ncbi:hypothetical protein LCGC14_1544980 [marine sediment metagenome]|uniref:Uncharacterized protein n=1 Tax=marine sediment metagenome TaxID=412755 RepID=A0A0F9LSQ1_9ZZZZ
MRAIEITGLAILVAMIVGWFVGMAMSIWYLW